MASEYKAPPISRDFFYQNIFEYRVYNAMMMAVRSNLSPFSNLLKSQMKSTDRIAKISADVELVSKKILLIPEFTIIRVDRGTESVFELPHINYYIFEWRDEYGEGEIEISNRDRTVCLSSKDILDINDGFAVFSSETEIQTNLNIWYGDNMGESQSFKPLLLDFVKDFGKYKCKSSRPIYVNGATRTHIICDGDVDELKLFGKVTLRSSKNESESQLNFVIDDGVKYTCLDSGELLVYRKSIKTISKKGQKLNYHPVDKSEYRDLLKDSNISFNGGELYLKEFNYVGDSYKSPHTAAVFSLNLNSKLTPKNKNGVLVRLIDNDSYDSDVFSSSSFFFREENKDVTDVPRSKSEPRGRQFRIVRKIEDDNVIEIVEIKNKKETRPDSIPSTLFIVPNTFQTRMQFQAVNVLINEPAPHHRELIRLMDDRAKWRPVQILEAIEEWFILKDPNFPGVASQRKMVELAINTNDFAFLEGPPGSGKTTTILEIIAQEIIRGHRVMLAASTNAAIDNILERLNKLPPIVKDKLIVARVGNEDSVSETVDIYRPETIEDADVRELVYLNANIVCGTTFGILNHPEFNLNGHKKYEMTQALFDSLIIDEASKTTFQDFLVPALFAKKWILSGDIKQLTPYLDKDELAGSIQQMSSFDANHQEMLGLVNQLTIDLKSTKGRRFLIPIGQSNIPIIRELMPSNVTSICVANAEGCISPADIFDGVGDCARLFAADFIFVDKSVLKSVSKYLPSANAMLLADLGENIECSYRTKYYYENEGRSICSDTIKINGNSCNSIQDVIESLSKSIMDHKWSDDIAWRIARIQELFMLSDVGDSGDQVEKYKNQINDRIPDVYCLDINEFLDPLRQLAIPSILQILKTGTALNVNGHKTVLNSGFYEADYDTRAVLLGYQSRMHPEISRYSRQWLYDNRALIDNPQLNRGWTYTEYPSHSWWIDVYSKEFHKNENPCEVDCILNEIDKFTAFTENNPRVTDGRDDPWTVAILTYYKVQEKLIKSEMNNKYNKSRSSSQRVFRFPEKNLILEVYSIDKYQGKEADLVFISMVKSGNVPLGFMDSPNRLNVALTRAKYQRVIVGNKRYFEFCRNKLLKELVGGFQ